MANKSSIDPIDRFLHEAKSRLRRHLPEQQVLIAVQEARSHMEQRCAELVAEGMHTAQAETTAVASFGDPLRWADDIAQSEYVDQHTSRAGLVARCAGSAAIAAGCVAWFGQDFPSLAQAWSPFEILGLACLMVMIVTSFLARQGIQRALLITGAIASLVLFTASGMTRFSVPGRYYSFSPAEADASISFWKPRLPAT